MQPVSIGQVANSDTRTLPWVATWYPHVNIFDVPPQELHQHFSCRYLIANPEVGEQGRRHWQVYFYLSRKETKRKLLEVLGGGSTTNGWTLFRRRGTHSQAQHYCKKPLEGCECEHCTKARALPHHGKWGETYEYGSSEGNKS